MDYGRLIVAMVTPMKADRSVDFDKAAQLAKKLVKDGVSAIVTSGTTGESPTLTADERIGLIKSVKAAVSIPVIGNAGTNDTAASIRNAVEAQSAGADGILVVAPYYNKPDQDMLYDHFAAIARSVSIPSMLYDVPGRTGIHIAPDTVIRLSKDVPTITALKDASGNLDDMTVILNGAAAGFRVYTGEDALTLPSLAIGAYGVVSVSGQVVGSRMNEMINAYLSGDFAGAARLHGQLRDVNKAMFMQPNPVPVKKALALTGFDVGSLRPPLKDASPAVTEELRKALKALGMI